MSNKKLFWIAFFILSCCEFAQVAYSKNMPSIPRAVKQNDSKNQIQEVTISESCQALNANISCKALPR